MTLKTGSPAPDFALRDQHGQVVRLTDFAGSQHLALVFYPFAFSGICTGELCELRDNMAVFADSNVQLAGVSCDPMYAQRAWAEAEKYDFPLLSDFWPHGETARAYGVFNETTGAAVRGTFLVDTAGIVRWSILNGPGQARPLAAYREAVAALRAADGPGAGGWQRG
ncbi:MAG: peroxiredoxin [Kineosporiaceae bacterium]